MKNKTIFLSLFLLFITFILNAQIPDGYYNSTENLTGEQLKSALHNIIKNHVEYPYTSSSTDTWDILKETDIDNLNPDNVLLFYSGWSVNGPQEYNNAQGWSREHVWAKSHGDFGTDTGVGTDVHNLKPADISVNSARGNDDFDNGGTIYTDGDGITECRTDSDSWEPRDAVKGDVARMLFYMATRYEGDSDEPDLELVDDVNTYDMNESGKGYHGKLSVLQKWHIEDPIDSFETRRNDLIYLYQENRNPFIDHPEFVSEIWDTDTDVEDVVINQFKVYPNPSKNIINIELPDNKTGWVTLYKMNGEIVLRMEMTGDFKLSTSNIKSGLYFLNIVTEEGLIFNSKQIIFK